MKRIGILRIAQESNAFAPVPSEVESFAHDLEGEALLRATAPDGTEVEGFLDHAELSGMCRVFRRRSDIEVVPLFSMWALPAGPLSRRAEKQIRARLRRSLDGAGPLDALCVALHGAMSGVGGSKPEVRFLRDLRETLGPSVPIVATIDLHAHLTAALLEPLDAAVAYRTNPHRDHARTGERAATLLLQILDGTVRPTVAWRHLPMVLGGGSTLDFRRPMRAIFRRMARMEADPRVLSVSLCMSHPWLDVPDLGWAALVITDGDRGLAEELAEELADRAWAVRHELPPRFPEPPAAIERARKARLRRAFGTVCMADASDLVGAGAPGDNTRLIRALLERAPDLTSLTVIRDTPTAQALFDEPLGSWQRVRVGGRYPGSSPALELEGRLRSRHQGPVFGRRICLDLGPMQLVVSETSPLVSRPSFYRSMGLRPLRADITMVKVFFPFRLHFALENRLALYVRTEGPTDLDAPLRIAFSLPTHPKDDVPCWRPADRVRRLGY